MLDSTSGKATVIVGINIFGQRDQLNIELQFPQHLRWRCSVQRMIHLWHETNGIWCKYNKNNTMRYYKIWINRRMLSISFMRVWTRLYRTMIWWRRQSWFSQLGNKVRAKACLFLWKNISNSHTPNVFIRNDVKYLKHFSVEIIIIILNRSRYKP